jgi:hypothetical protein
MPVRIVKEIGKEAPRRRQAISKVVTNFTWVYRDAQRHDSDGFSSMHGRRFLTRFKGKFMKLLPARGNSYWGSPGE